MHSCEVILQKLFKSQFVDLKIQKSPGGLTRSLLKAENFLQVAEAAEVRVSKYKKCLMYCYSLNMEDLWSVEISRDCECSLLTALRNSWSRSCNHKELNSTNELSEPERGFFPGLPDKIPVWTTIWLWPEKT